MLSADDVWFSYANGTAPPAVAGVSLAVDERGIVGILGPNGSGKTTLLKLLAGMLRPSRGHVRLRGRDLSACSRAEIARELAVVPQETRPAFDYTALEIVLMGRYPHLGAFAIEGPEDVHIARDALAATGTSMLEHRRFETLSGGEKQRVVIAAALAQSARVLLLDEPTSSLDLAYQLEIASLVVHLNRARGAAIVLSTHDLNLAASVCRTLVLLKQGRVVATGATGEVLTPAHIATVFGVEAEVATHARAGHLTVVPIRPAGAG